MNKEKIQGLYVMVAEQMQKDSLDDEEFLVFVANLLLGWGSENLVYTEDLKNLNIHDAYQVEVALNQYPDNPFLAAILQAHVILKWSENFK